ENDASLVKEQLLHGVARRLSVIKKAIENIFDKFPPTTERPLSRDDLYDVQINLHAYVINISGIFDNWAWAFVHRHNLFEEVGGKHGVGLFRNGTSQFLPPELSSYLSSETTVNWQTDYVKEYRDALAHRIPLYIPPAEYTPEEGIRYNQLESQKIDLIKSMAWDELDETYEQQAELGKPSFYSSILMAMEQRIPYYFIHRFYATVLLLLSLAIYSWNIGVKLPNKSINVRQQAGWTAKSAASQQRGPLLRR
ncbi:MAG: hypothetical protein AB9Q18_08415, partial [Candidatus Reddybacter sp.]